MKTTLEIPDPLLRKAKSTAALRGQTLKQFVTEAMQEKLNGADAATHQPWMEFFGACKAQSQALRKIDAIIEEEFERIDPEEWK